MVHTVKIGYASSASARGRNSSSSRGPSSRNSIDSANLPEPFPRPQTPLEKKRDPATNIPPADYRNMHLLTAKVKSVLSGDSVILCAVDNPAKERILSLAYCTSPHLKRDADERWAYDSRDALRRLIVGRVVQFTILYTIPNTMREYGIIFMGDSRKLPEEMVKEGWLKLREDAGRKEDSPEATSQLDRLRYLEATARSLDKGLWGTTGGIYQVQHDMGDPQSFLAEYKGQTIDGLVERVLSGDRMLVRLIITPTKHIQGG